MHVRRTFREQQLQHLLAGAQREEDLLSSGQPGPLAPNADPCRPAAGKPLRVCANVDATLERREAATVSGETAPGEAEATTAVPPEVPQASAEAEHAAEAEEQEGDRYEEEEQTSEDEKKTRERHVDDYDGELG